MANKLECLIYDMPTEWQEKAEFSSCDGDCDSLDVLGDYITYLESVIKDINSQTDIRI